MDQRIFYIRSPQPNPDRGISYILSQTTSPLCLSKTDSFQWAHTPPISVTSTISFPPTHFHGPKDLLYPKSTTQPRLMDLLYPKSTTIPLCLLTTDSVQWAHTPLPSFQVNNTTSFPPAHFPHDPPATASSRVRHSHEDDQSILIETSKKGVLFRTNYYSIERFSHGVTTSCFPLPTNNC